MKSKLSLILVLLLAGLTASFALAGDEGEQATKEKEQSTVDKEKEAKEKKSSKKGRRLPAKAYVSSAKIEILGYAEKKEEARIKLAQAMLDSLFLNYGAHSEGYYWYSQIKWDLAKEKSNLKERLPFVRAAIAYADSLKASCKNDSINKEYRKDCAKLSESMDSVRVAEWRDYYNNAIEQIKEVEEQADAVKTEQDSTAKAFFQTRLDAITDSCQDNMELAIAIDSADARPFIGLATINEKIGKYDKAIELFKRGMPYAEDRNQMLISIAYDYIYMDKYCDAIPWFIEYVDSMTANSAVMQKPENRTAVISTAQNLAICQNNCKDFDGAYSTFNRILAIEPEDVSSLVGLARYQQHRGREAGDSAKAAREAKNDKVSADWQAVRDVRFDSARVSLKKAFELAPDDAGVAAEYGLMAAILQKYDEAKVAFVRATQLAPQEIDNWTSLGDCNVSLQAWADAAEAYEHVVELAPDRKAVWERLSDLYAATKNQKRLAEVQKKLESM